MLKVQQVRALSKRRLWSGAACLAFIACAGPGFGQTVVAASTHNFQGYPIDGSLPQGGTLVDRVDPTVIYGTTSQGGTKNAGEVYKLTGAPGSKLVKSAIYNFKAFPDLGSPSGRLYQDASGALYGGCTAGGVPGKSGRFVNNGGIFKLTPPPNGHGEWIETILHTYPYNRNGPYNNNVSGLVADKYGNLYGTTFIGRGSVFQIRPDGTYRDVHFFSGFPDGQGPSSPLTVGPDGVLYGVTQYGGTNACGGFGCGGVYSLTPTGKNSMPIFAPLFGFNSGKGGHAPAGPVAVVSTGDIYGSNTVKNVFDSGVIFRVTPALGSRPATETVVYDLGGSLQPFNGVVMDAAGGIYSTYSKGFSGLTFEFYLAQTAPGSHQYTNLVQLLELHGGGFHTDGVTLTSDAASGDLILDDILGEGLQGANANGSAFRLLLKPAAPR